MNDETVVCNCFNVTVKDIKEAINNGAKSFEEVQEVTSISNGCGSCTDEAKNIVKELLV